MDQLEIIGANGEVEFYNLDPGKGLTNIGQHPENDIVIDDPRVAPFQAMLDHRQKPYQLMVLSDEGYANLGGTPLPLHQAQPLQNLDHIELGGYTLILVENNGAAGGGAAASFSAVPVPLPARPAATSPPFSRPESLGAYQDPTQSSPQIAPRPVPSSFPETGPAIIPTGPIGLFTARPHDQEDDVILTELSENEWQIDVEQTATCQLTIINGGQLVASFEVRVQGLDPSWVTISQPYINLNEGERTTVSISFTPPRLPSSRARAHYLAVAVTSSNHPGRSSQHGATLTINPYYEFAVDELSPKRQVIPWAKRFGKTIIPVINKGNSVGMFRLEGSNEERACNFEFDVPGEVVPLATQAEVRLHPEESISLPIHITPHSRRLVGFNKRRYAFTITTSLPESQQTPRSMLGELNHKPLIGPWVFFLIALLFICLILFLVKPRLYNFMLADGGQVAVVRNETPVAIRWNASFFTTDRAIDPPIEGLEQPLPRQGTVVAYPKKGTTYTFSGGNALSRLVPSIFAAPTKAVQVQVIALPPEVSFEANPAQVVGDGEDEVVLNWVVRNADNILLFRQVGDNGPLEQIGDYSEQPVQSIRVTPDPNSQNTTYILIAKNDYVPTPTPYPQRVAVLTPTPTRPPTPEIVLFNASPPTINEGEESTLSWVVNGVDTVRIQGIDADTLPSEYSFSVQPTASTEYFLTVPGLPPIPVRVNVIPATPTPTGTPVPDAPQILFFTADPEELVQGQADPQDDEKDSVLQWSISGEVTNVELNGGPDIGIFSGLNPEDTFPVSIDKTTVFVLTAYNQDKKNSQTVQIEVLDATPTPEPSATPEPPPSATPTPIQAQIKSFKVSFPGTDPPVNPVDLNSEPKVYEIMVNTQVTFEWQVDNAAKVTFTAQTGLGVESEEVVATTIQKTITGTVDSFYQLDAENKEAQKTTPARIQIKIVDQLPPAPPFSVTGTQNAADNVLSWNWSNSSSIQSNIIGYRLYGATVPVPGTYSVVANESTLTAGVKTYTHTTAPSATCNKGYYVVAVYKNLAGTTKESAASLNSWFSSPCP